MRLASLGSTRLPTHSVRLMASILDEQRLDVGRALRLARIPESVFEDPAGTVSGIQELAFQRAFMEQTPERPDVWLQLGSRYRLLSHAHTAYGLMMSTSPTVESALRCGLSYSQLYYTLATAVGIFEEGRLVGFCSFFSELPQELRRFAILRDVAVNCTVVSDLWGSNFPFEKVSLPLPKSDEPFVRRFLPDAQLEFERDINCWRWSVRADLKSPPQSDPVLHQVFTQTCDALLSEVDQEGDVIGRIATLLTASGGKLAVEDVARRLGLSSRTLQRRLNDRGLSYRELALLERHQVACRMLVETDAPIGRIAEEVGYDNPCSFNIAFRRQAGVSPGVYRRGAY
jgi:AraC-like DNA-binding protein